MNRVRGIKTLIWISIVALLVTTVVSMGTSNTGTELFGGAGGAYEGRLFGSLAQMAILL